MAMALHTLADHLAFENVEGCEQGGGAMSLVVVREGCGAALRHRQAGLSPVERLDLALLVNRQNDGMVRRIDTLRPWLRPSNGWRFGTVPPRSRPPRARQPREPTAGCAGQDAALAQLGDELRVIGELEPTQFRLATIVFSSARSAAISSIWILFVHSPDSHDRVRRGILKRIEMSDLAH
jgi:hypothetical protein